MSDEEILATIKRIEGKLDESAVLSRRQWQYALGIGIMFTTLAVLPYSNWGAALVFILGYVLMITSSKKLWKMSRD